MPVTKEAPVVESTAPESPPPNPLPRSEPRRCEHVVQFYETDAFLADTVTRYVLEGLQRGECILLVATLLHQRAIATRLDAHGIDVLAAKNSGQYQPLDAADLLTQVMVGPRPSRARFDQTVGRIVRAARSRWSEIRVFGEMVALLAERGNSGAAIQLEKFWNQLIREHPFPLFCTYPLQAFRQAPDRESLAHICDAHTQIIPPEKRIGQQALEKHPAPLALSQQKDAQQEEHPQMPVANRAACHLDVSTVAAHLGAWNYDLVSQLLVASPECRAHFGLDPDEPIRRERALRMIHEEDRARVKRVLVHALRARSAFATECRVVLRSGEVRWISTMGRLVQENARQIVGVTVDITGQKQATEKTEETMLLRTAQLRESLDELEAFSYSVSHDMRAPLRAMQAYARSTLEDFGSDLDPQVVSNLRRIERAALRLDALVRDVLAYSRIAKSPLELVPVSLDDIMGELLAQHSENARRCIKVNFPLHHVIGNEACLVQCLGNLLTNALKFTEPGVPADVRVWSERIGRLVKVSVRDRGVGIHPHHHGRVFQMFNRIYPEQRYEGTGMGLAIAKKAVARMGGDIGFTSELGRGSTFWFKLPAVSTSL